MPVSKGRMMSTRQFDVLARIDHIVTVLTQPSLCLWLTAMNVFLDGINRLTSLLHHLRLVLPEANLLRFNLSQPEQRSLLGVLVEISLSSLKLHFQIIFFGL